MYTFGLCHVVVLPYSPTGKYTLSICIGNRRHSYGFSHRNDHDRFLYAGYLLDYRYPSSRHSLLLDSRVRLLGIQTIPIVPLFQKSELEREKDIMVQNHIFSYNYTYSILPDEYVQYLYNYL